MTDEQQTENALDEVTPKLRHSADAIEDDNLRINFCSPPAVAWRGKSDMKKKS
jgi:hypothetical protein